MPGAQLWTCGADRKWAIGDCPHGCENAACKPEAECVAATKLCENGNLKICSSAGKWNITTCSQGCENGACKEPQCTYGEKKCQSNQVWVCKEDRTWQITDCPHGCDQNACLPAVCESTEKRCSPTNAKQPQVCNSNRSGFEDSGALCTEYCKSGVCVQFACQPKETRCSLDNSKTEVCNSAQTAWETQTTCKDGCVKNTTGAGICALCGSGQKRCNNGKPETCDPVTGWTVGSDCGSGDVCTVDGCYYNVLLDFTDQNENLNELAYWMAWCWSDFGSGNDNKMCYGLDISKLPKTISETDLKNWFCKGIEGDNPTVTKANFASTTPGDDGSSLFKVAEDMFGCTGPFNAVNFSFQTSGSNLPALTSGSYCIYHDATAINEVFVDECKDF